MLEETRRVAESLEVAERDPRAAPAAHALIRTLSESRAEDARSRYCWATELHSNDGLRRSASAARPSASPGSVSTLRRAAAMASGFCRSTRSPAPLESSSTAREGGCHHGLACGHSLHQDARRHLLARVVGQQDDFGLPHEAAQLVRLEVPRVEGDHVVDAKFTGPGLESMAIGLPSRSTTFGWVSPTTWYLGAGWMSRSRAMAEMPHSIPLPSPSSPHVRMIGPLLAARGAT